jgi:hypothetical protein
MKLSLRSMREKLVANPTIWQGISHFLEAENGVLSPGAGFSEKWHGS